MSSIFPSITELKDIANSTRVRKEIANTLRVIAAQGASTASFEVIASKGQYYLQGVLIRELIDELTPLGYKCELNVDSSDRSYSFDIYF